MVTFVAPTDMPTPVEVSYVKRGTLDRFGITGLGGMWRDRPWYLSVESIIWWIEQPDDRRQWDFYVQACDKQLPIIVSSGSDGKCVTIADELHVLFALPEWPRELERLIPS